MADNEDTALQPERTGLAWVRTLVVVGGVWGLISFHSFHDHGWIPVTVACGAVALLLVAAAGWIGTSRGRTTRRMLEGGGRMTAPGALLAVSALGVAAAVVALTSTLVVS